MKQQYINKVMKELAVPANRKREIARDIEEIFSSAQEHGETEQQVIDRLGSPEEFASNINDQVVSRQAKNRHAKTIIFAVISILAFVTYGFTKSLQIPAGVIGQANATTNIQLASNLSLNFPDVFLMVGIIALIITFVNIVRNATKNRR